VGQGALCAVPTISPGFPASVVGTLRFAHPLLAVTFGHYVQTASTLLPSGSIKNAA
jgi:hypothetical protein